MAIQRMEGGASVVLHPKEVVSTRGICGIGLAAIVLITTFAIGIIFPMVPSLVTTQYQKILCYSFIVVGSVGVILGSFAIRWIMIKQKENNQALETYLSSITPNQMAAYDLIPFSNGEISFEGYRVRHGNEELNMLAIPNPSTQRYALHIFDSPRALEENIKEFDFLNKVHGLV